MLGKSILNNCVNKVVDAMPDTIQLKGIGTNTEVVQDANTLSISACTGTTPH